MKIYGFNSYIFHFKGNGYIPFVEWNQIELDTLQVRVWEIKHKRCKRECK